MNRGLLGRAAGGVAGAIDRAFVAGAVTPSRRARGRDRAESLDHAARMRGLAVLEAFYGDPRWMQPSSGFLPRPDPIVPEVKPIKRLAGTGELLELRWPSEFETLWSNEALRGRLSTLPRDWSGSDSSPPAAALRETIDQTEMLRGDFRARYLAAKQNRTAIARHYRHDDGPRPAVALMHGFLGGFLPMEARMLAAEQFFQGGMDVILTVLPLHGSRRDRSRPLYAPQFPGSDPRYTIEGFRQLVFDHQALFDYLLDGQVRSIGVGGMSLGGYGAALLATIDPRLTFSLMQVPLSCVAAFAKRSGRMVGDAAEQEAQTAALQRVQWPVNPCARPSLLPTSRVHIVTGASDRVTGADQSAPLQSHFGGHHQMFPGGHVLQFQRHQALEPFWQTLRSAGLWNGSAKTGRS